MGGGGQWPCISFEEASSNGPFYSDFALGRTQNTQDIKETFVLSLSKSPLGSCQGYPKSVVFTCGLFFLLRFIEEVTSYVK